ncbi:MAG: T9SS type A sorting domain-containing protein [Saprospiraceae bacterium]|nr:T9SS type A sorting domain-containing protein [Saprospiraceae bacterium]
MKYFTRLSLTLLMGFMAIYANGQNNEDGINHCGKADAFNSQQKLANYSNPLTENYDLKYYRFNWLIDPSQYFIAGSATPYFRVIKDNFNEIYFDFSHDFIIDSIIYHGNTLSYSQPEEYQIRIIFPDNIPNGTLDSLSIFYHGAPPNSGFGSFIQSTHGNGIPVLWTLSEPFGAQDWWPCKNGLDDKIDSIDVFITTPEIYRGASNGKLVSETSVEGGMKIYHWQHRHPIASYLVAIAVTDYTVYTHDVPLRNGTIMPMVNYVYPENKDKAEIGTLNNVKVLQFYDSLFVTYPFYNEKYGHAQFGWGGGMEHQTMSFVVNFGWGLLAHELGHQWFGDHITCGSWQDIWLNEGFATYLDGLTREHFFTPTDWYNWKSSMLNSIKSRPDGSVKVDDINSVDRIFSSRLTYNKGAYLLHMLRWKLGDDLFFKGVRAYLNEMGGKFARTPDLQRNLEQVSGVSLKEFFKDWYEGQGYPIYDVKWENLDNNKVRIQLSQTTSHPSVDFFEIPVHIRLKGADKEYNIRIDSFKNLDIFEYNPGFKVLSVEFNPELWIISSSTVTNGVITVGNNKTPNSQIKCYPNPTSDILTLNMQLPVNQQLQYQIIGTNGRTILHGIIRSDNQSIEVKGLPPGAYQIIVNEHNKVLYNGGFIKA